MTARHVAVVGMPGTGKSTVADLLAEDLGVAKAHLDEMVESAAARSIEDLFAERGEGRFREIESACLLELLAAEEPTVVACGGGVPTVVDNVERLQKPDVVVVWLTALPETLHARLEGDSRRRPLLREPEDLDRLYRQRRHLYWRVCDVAVATDGRTPDSVAGIVSGRLRLTGFPPGD